jgi:hypothetical protein
MWEDLTVPLSGIGFAVATAVRPIELSKVCGHRPAGVADARYEPRSSSPLAAPCSGPRKAPRLESRYWLSRTVGD